MLDALPWFPVYGVAYELEFTIVQETKKSRSATPAASNLTVVVSFILALKLLCQAQDVHSFVKPFGVPQSRTVG